MNRRSLTIVIVALIFALWAAHTRLRRRIRLQDRSAAAAQVEKAPYQGRRATAIAQQENPVRSPSTRNRVTSSSATDRYYTRESLWSSGDSRIFGTVRSEEGDALAGVKLRLFPGEPYAEDPVLKETASDQNGSYTLTQVNDYWLDYVVLAKAEGFCPVADIVRLRGKPLQHDIVLGRSRALQGIVTDTSTSLPLAKVKITWANRTLAADFCEPVCTDLTGRFQIAIRPGQLHSVYAEREDYVTTCVPVEDFSREFRMSMDPGGATVSGIVIGRTSQKVEPGAKVVLSLRGNEQSRARLARTIMSKDGRFCFAGLGTGSYELFAIRGVRLTPKPLRLDVAGNEKVEGIQLELASKIQVQGKAIEIPGEAPVGSVQSARRMPQACSQCLWRRARLSN